MFICVQREVSENSGLGTELADLKSKQKIEQEKGRDWSHALGGWQLIVLGNICFRRTSPDLGMVWVEQSFSNGSGNRRNLYESMAGDHALPPIPIG